MLLSATFSAGEADVCGLVVGVGAFAVPRVSVVTRTMIAASTMMPTTIAAAMKPRLVNGRPRR